MATQGSSSVVRDANAGDAPACAAIYRPYVTDTAISFESEPPSVAEMARRIELRSATHAWLVLQRADRVVGYAYATAFRERAAYAWTCETTVYLELGLRRSGAGRELYTALLERLTARGFQTAMGVIALPNDASVGLHAALGFEHIGTLRRNGYKHGTWHDVAYTQRTLNNEDPPRTLR